MKSAKKILQIGNYPPPMCGWAIQTKLVTDELRRRGHICEILKINENRRMKDPSYIDIQGGPDYVFKVLRHAIRGYQLNVHLNGQSRKGYILALIAVLTGRLAFRPTLVTFHGGLSQAFFPRLDSTALRWAFQVLFNLAGGIACDSLPIKEAIANYGVRPEKIETIETFSAQYLEFRNVPLAEEIEAFLRSHDPVLFCYVSFRPEYRLEMLREAMARFREHSPRAGFIWLGFPAKELPGVQQFVQDWSAAEQQSLLLVGNLTHDQFLTLLSRSHICVRTPACDGVAASVLESLALGIPVVASENGRRPVGTVRYDENSSADLCSKLVYVSQHYDEIKSKLGPTSDDDNVGRMADWLAGESMPENKREVAHAT